MRVPPVEVGPQVRPVEPRMMDVIHAHRKEERAAVSSPKLEDREQRIVAEGGNLWLTQLPRFYNATPTTLIGAPTVTARAKGWGPRGTLNERTVTV